MEVPNLHHFADKDWPEPEKGFAAMIHNIDRDTGRVLDLLEELGIEKETLLGIDSNGKYRGIKRDLYEGGIRVPTIAYWPGTIEPSSSNNHQWYFGDLMATVAELSGQPIPEGLDSDSFLPTLKATRRKRSGTESPPLYWEFEGGTAQAVRFGKWKAVRKPIFTGKIELYDLSWDHGEKRDHSERRYPN